MRSKFGPLIYLERWPAYALVAFNMCAILIIYCANYVGGQFQGDPQTDAQLDVSFEGDPQIILHFDGDFERSSNYFAFKTMISHYKNVVNSVLNTERI